MFNFLSDCGGKAYAIVVAVKLSVVAGNEVGPQDPDGTCRGRHIQAPECDGADVPLYLWLLLTRRTVLIWLATTALTFTKVKEIFR